MGITPDWVVAELAKDSGIQCGSVAAATKAAKL
jgi:hypothetical protein